MAEVSVVKHEKDDQKVRSELNKMISLNKKLVIDIVRLKTALHAQTEEIELLKKKLAVYDSL